ETVADLIREWQTPSPARLAEHFRETEHERIVDQLLSWNPPRMAEEGWEALFDDALEQLRTHARQNRLDELLHQSAIRDLTPDEKAELKTLLASR
ncbi:MAG TPA: hypothetical protein ENK26_02700, partial [Gammaproteobacteria bacterium]|nr:hypothetical protein [Gammaproteobacteria bacterium]